MKRNFILLFTLILFKDALSCTNYIVTKGASAEGVNMFSYSADSFPMYGDLYHFAAGHHDPNTEFVDVYDWNTDVYLGRIPQAEYTYNVIGNMNEYSLAIGETTWGGIELIDENAIIDYGTLIYLTLQRCKTAREAISFINETLNKYGYYSDGESFTIADPDEIWIMDLASKGPYQTENGSRFVFVATRVPDGHISGHANQARTGRIAWNDPDNVIYTPDIYEWAFANNLTNRTKEEFDFTETFNPLEPSGTRSCDGRVFAFYHSVVTEEQSVAWEPYVYGRDNEHRLPFTLDMQADCVVKKKVSLPELQSLIGNHYEGTSFNQADDMSGTYYHELARPRPLSWTAEYKGEEHLFTHERAAGCQQTAWNFIACCKRELADGTTVNDDVDPLAQNTTNVVLTGGVFWFSCDDATCSVQIPIFPCTTAIPPQLSRDKANIFLLNRNTLFWANSLVANWVYTNWQNMSPVLKAKQEEEKSYFLQAVSQAQSTLADLAHADPNVAVEFANQVAKQYAAKLVADWNDFYGELFRRFFDGMEHIVVEGQPLPTVKQLSYQKAMYAAIVEETGLRYLYPGGHMPDEAAFLRRLKRTVDK